MDICMVIRLPVWQKVVTGWCAGVGASLVGTGQREILALPKATHEPRQDGYSQDRDDEDDGLIPRKAASMEIWKER